MLHLRKADTGQSLQLGYDGWQALDATRHNSLRFGTPPQVVPKRRKRTRVVQAFLDVLVEDNLNRGDLGRDCALDRLMQEGGYVFLPGVDHTSNSAIHIGEDYAGAIVTPCSHRRTRRLWS